MIVLNLFETTRHIVLMTKIKLITVCKTFIYQSFLLNRILIFGKIIHLNTFTFHLFQNCTTVVISPNYSLPLKNCQNPLYPKNQNYICEQTNFKKAGKKKQFDQDFQKLSLIHEILLFFSLHQTKF